MNVNTLLGVVAALALSGVSGAAPAIDAQGKCRDNGKFVEARLCAVKPAATKCRDITTKKFAKCGAANTEAVPKKS